MMKFQWEKITFFIEISPMTMKQNFLIKENFPISYTTTFATFYRKLSQKFSKTYKEILLWVPMPQYIHFGRIVLKDFGFIIRK